MITLTIQHLTVAFGGRTVLDIPELALDKAQLIVLSGPSGSGKSTFLNIISGLLVPEKGQVAWYGEELFNLTDKNRAKWRARQCGFMFQDFHLLSALSILDNVLMPVFFRMFRPTQAQKDQAIEQLRCFGLTDVSRRVATLSRGERQRVAMARALFENAPVLLADEPTASLDRENAEFVVKQLKHQTGQGRFVLTVSHDPLVQEAADVHLRLSRGSLI